jgi:hypothetical protein
VGLFCFIFQTQADKYFSFSQKEMKEAFDSLMKEYTASKEEMGELRNAKGWAEERLRCTFRLSPQDSFNRSFNYILFSN